GFSSLLEKVRGLVSGGSGHVNKIIPASRFRKSFNEGSPRFLSLAQTSSACLSAMSLSSFVSKNLYSSSVFIGFYVMSTTRSLKNCFGCHRPHDDTDFVITTPLD
ncbi:MAG: hypothetical protein ACOC6E_02835, partial [Thermodesulfobacteriota bacterium]